MLKLLEIVFNIPGIKLVRIVSFSALKGFFKGITLSFSLAKEFKKNFLGKIPISTKLRESADLGLPLAYKEPSDEISKIFLEIADKVIQDVV